MKVYSRGGIRETRYYRDSLHKLVRNGYLPIVLVQIGIGDVEVKVSKIRDRSSNGIFF